MLLPAGLDVGGGFPLFLQELFELSESTLIQQPGFLLFHDFGLIFFYRHQGLSQIYGAFFLVE